MKSHTNEHTVRGGPTLKDVQCFRNGSVRKPNERSIYERTFMSEPNHGIIKFIPNELSNLNLDKKHFRSVIAFLDVIMIQVESQCELWNI